jgi:hypothetical protein
LFHKGKYDQFKQDVLVDGKNRLLLIRDVTGTPSPQASYNLCLTEYTVKHGILMIGHQVG